ncbi:MAG: hypothetical protein M0C28_02965 [Candidatus Moduliflexus flocculans]|nr:hypothetical protein [Candidatus Moduliflexus flocculans]
MGVTQSQRRHSGIRQGRCQPRILRPSGRSLHPATAAWASGFDGSPE